MAPRPALIAIGHATSGSIGTAISTAALAPLDLVTTRLKAQRHLGTQQYDGILDAFRAIVTDEGGVSALYSGLGPDVFKSIVDSFLFFGFYNYLRRQNKRPGILKELATGAFAGACAKAFTTPLSNVVTRKQMSSNQESLWKIFANIIQENGILGLWSGYSATLVLTLNPGITFFVNGRLASRIIPALEEEDVPIAWAAFLLAATSKATAVALTYPFQAAKTRLQMPADSPRNSPRGSPRSLSPTQEKDLESQRSKQRSRLLKLWNMTIFSVVYRIMKDEGLRALYGGLQGELLKNFFAHGLTMLTKGLIHRWVIRLWYFMVPYLRDMRSRRLASK
ncbi:Peroxisomal adenine nucleotide carrier 1 [Cladobotryum mycophilum]|uniref:Peroxisomal adenine nucleotide carrier 1 n=1 Tax=Cladobotryum mycophilum TaxID=491253 RepID=A0ABR0SAA0_9HYPO